MREQETDSVLENEQSSELFVRNAFLVPKRTLISDQRLKISHWLHVFFNCSFAGFRQITAYRRH